MDFTVNLSKMFELSPFQVLKEDKDAVIMLINYYIEKGQETPNQKTTTIENSADEKRIRVNDKTATGGWF